MKFSLCLVSLLPVAFALPAGTKDESVSKRQSANTVTDQLLFSVSLPTFTARRNARDPPTLIWDSDGCTSSPDNPFGFPFVPACNRHDFGYHNYRAQSRFTVSGKVRIDSNFKTDLYYQCESSSVSGVCRALADVYYAAVRAFGGDDATPGKRSDSELVKEYEEKVAIYNKLVEEAQEKGDLPRLD
ncbi:phospholipase A2 [Fusarium vanettenii 77-13-4]|uniref:Phospholipase A2 n=1 Tax=Fusarium vanettenii (strain ATCC MYA-4622 / CBS 123669 / FGSC 9596 / NRRL 45880 / 77-13-4) TaxID=660122 RepID=C7ZGD6_FUSV7|nr:phospholipase A2 [Fusarium vanettenii 77-13-4]EEU36829.1 phospholipase A2 [Fusarium vanettenii 77-13-4]